MASRRLPSIFYNWVSVIGALIAVAMFGMIVLLYLIDAFVQGTTIYLGLLTFLVLPTILVLGLVLIAVGAILERRRQARGETSSFSGLIHIDLQKPAHRNAVMIWTMGTVVLLLATSVGTYRAYQATESVAFCGEVCHDVMRPEYVAYGVSPHARVRCAECHIGPGAEWFVQAKLTGLYQVYAVLADVYPRPIPTPVANLRPARETCEHCHWPEKFFGSRKVVNPHFLSDEENTPYPITMLLKVGGADERVGRVEGIHWHVASANRMEYVARDAEREEIVWVRMTDANGQVVEYNHSGEPLADEERARHGVRQLDCMDCHNRPSHHYRSPVKTVNYAMAHGQIDPELPYIKVEAVSALSGEYADTPTALRQIEARLSGFYREDYPEVWEEKRARVEAAVAAVQRIYQQNFFPEMKVSWKAYPDHIGHSEFVGCFRCHGSALETADGKTITKDCMVCHTILAQGVDPAEGTYSPRGLKFEHPVDIGGAEEEGMCAECHEGGAELY